MTFDFDLIFRVMSYVCGPNGLLFGLRKGSIKVLWSTHVVQQILFSMFSSMLTFDFDLILELFLTLWGPNGLFLGLGLGSKTVLGSPHID